MLLTVSNLNDFDVYLYVNQTQYTIKAHTTNVTIESNSKDVFLSVKRKKNLPLPEFKKLFLLEFFNVVGLLLVGPTSYVLDVSTEYYLPDNQLENANLKITRKVKDAKRNCDIEYDSVCIISEDSKLYARNYNAENKEEITSLYKKVKKKAFFWQCFALELAFLFLSITIAFPLLIVCYQTTKLLVFRIFMWIVPIFSILLIALIALLPLYLYHKHDNAQFYQELENKAIVEELNKV